MMSSNLPPGITESMIPGNRPEDEEVEIILFAGEIDIIKHELKYNSQNMDNELVEILKEIVEQSEEVKGE